MRRQLQTCLDRDRFASGSNYPCDKKKIQKHCWNTQNTPLHINLTCSKLTQFSQPFSLLNFLLAHVGCVILCIGQSYEIPSRNNFSNIECISKFQKTCQPHKTIY